MGQQLHPRVLIVEDALLIAKRFNDALTCEGMLTEIALCADAVAQKRSFRPSVVVIDQYLGDRSGTALIESFARDADCGVIVVTANEGEASRFASLDIGADDCMMKPVSMRELAARVRAVHRRVSRPCPAGDRPPAVLVDTQLRRLIGPGDRATQLTEAELRVLEALLDANGLTVSRDTLGRRALRRTIAAQDRCIDQLVLKLRRKISRHGMTDRAILSRRGLGYVIAEPAGFAVPAALTRAAAGALGLMPSVVSRQAIGPDM